MRICIGVLRGAGKAECEDTAFFDGLLVNERVLTIESSELRCIGVSDGVGGNAGGKMAASYVAQWISQTDFSTMTGAEIRDCICKINAEMVAYASQIPGKEEMATTLTGIVAGKDGFYMIHAGNTRVYVMQGAYLRQLSADHTTYQWLMAQGEHEAAEKSNRSEIVCCLGGGNPHYAKRLTVEKVFDDYFPDTILMTSDGIHEFVDIDKMEHVLTTCGSDCQSVEMLMEAAVENGSADDRTIIIVRR